MFFFSSETIFNSFFFFRKLGIFESELKKSKPFQKRKKSQPNPLQKQTKLTETRITEKRTTRINPTCSKKKKNQPGPKQRKKEPTQCKKQSQLFPKQIESQSDTKAKKKKSASLILRSSLILYNRVTEPNAIGDYNILNLGFES